MCESTTMPPCAPSARPASSANLVSGRTPTERMTRSASREVESVSSTARPSSRAVKAAAAVEQVQSDAPAAEMMLDGDRHLVVERGQYLIGEFDDIDDRAAMSEVLGHLEADVAGADDDASHGPSAALSRDGEGRIELRLDGVHVADTPQDVDARQIDPRNRRSHRFGSGAQRERIVTLGVLAPRIDFADPDGPGFAIDLGHFAAHAHVDVERLAQTLGRLQQQATPIGDDPADVVRQTAVGERDVVAPFEHDDLGCLVESARSRCHRGSRRDSTHDDDLHLRPFAQVIASVQGLLSEAIASR